MVVSPLNAIISDQIEKLESRGIGVKVFKQGYQGVVTTIDDDVKFIYGHAKVFAENDSVKGLLRSPFKDRIKTIVIDEAHFIIQWEEVFYFFSFFFFQRVSCDFVYMKKRTCSCLPILYVPCTVRVE